jgi:prepilin-type N-terminal cleavage/methylation domain-containing protein
MAYSMRHAHRGFTLIEVAISMVILGLVLTGLVVSLSQQLQQRRLLDTRTALKDASDALMAFVSANARLPCPATVASNGLESMVPGPTAGVCTNAAGFLPAVTLGLPNLDRNGLLNDGWADGSTHDNASPAINYPRAIRYSVALLLATGPAQNYALTKPSLGGPGITRTRAAVGATLAVPPTTPGNSNGLFVCRSLVGIAATPNRCGTAANSLALNAVAVIWSQGPTGIDRLGNSLDENQNAGQLTGAGVARTFVMHDPTGPAAASGRFDDVVSWVSWGAVADKLWAAAGVP